MFRRRGDIFPDFPRAPSEQWQLHALPNVRDEAPYELFLQKEPMLELIGLFKE